MIHNPLPQPTLPDIKLDDEYPDDATTIRTRGTGTNDYYYSDYKNAYANDYPPPMPAYSQQYGGYAQSVHSTEDPSHYYADNYDSQTSLTGAAAPIARQTNNSTPNPHNAAAYNGGYGYDGQNGGYGHDGYSHDGHAGYGQDVPGAYAVGGDPNEYAQYGQAHSNYGQGHEQDIGQAHAYAYEPHTANVPARTASRATNHQYDAPAYQQSRQGRNGGTGYDAYGHNSGGGYAVG